MRRGGKSSPALEKSDPEGSLLLQRIAQGEMPPGQARKLPARGPAVSAPAPAASRPARSVAATGCPRGRTSRARGYSCPRAASRRRSAVEPALGFLIPVAADAVGGDDRPDV